MPQSLTRLYAHLVFSTKHWDEAEHYVRNQAEHHRRQTFQDEYRLMLKRNHVDFDEQYVWD